MSLRRAGYARLLGNERVLRTMKVGVLDEAGEMSQLLGISMDITEQVITRTAMKEGAELMQVVFDNVADGIITLDHLGRLLSINRAAELMFGYTGAEVQGQSVKVLLPHSLHASADEFLEKSSPSLNQGASGVTTISKGEAKTGVFPLWILPSQAAHT